MANILVSAEKGIQVAAEDVLKFLTHAQAVEKELEPGTVAALGVLLGAVESALVDVQGVAANPLNIQLDIATVNNLKAVWPAVQGFAASIGIKL